ncbi:hypothetical protein LU674_008765 [Pseudomonas alloputida]|uniref:DUF3077 domain-containing protein n=2 Tax=Pseudomonas TaxID=286 RepID=A0AAW7HTH5_9PSED|nr:MULTISPECIES: hypothetical protein [Pseudomonas]MCE0862345.1 hypothetical protein [Pseudomonas alloputida]MCE0891572.1 hypothetical protein [Pseudomonas alloputida]MCE0920693.1 hypothetical protein [Pseudomonas alloputida]MCE1047155.1 hypothetical protein [Pseudomonas alloputida]MCE1127546.1 hypothetical protein [Pseudomonas alloputida]
MTRLSTQEAHFFSSGVKYRVNAGTSCNTAITAAGAMLSSVNCLLGNLIGDGADGSSELYAIRVLTVQCEALLEAIEIPVRDMEGHAPQKPTSPDRGAEASQ